MLDKKPISIADIRYDEIAKSGASRYSPNTTFQNLFDDRLNRMSGKRDRVQVVTSSFCEWRVVRSLNRTQGCRNSNKVIYSK